MRKSFFRSLPIEWYAIILPYSGISVALFVAHPWIFGSMGGAAGIGSHLLANYFSLLFYLLLLFALIRYLSGVVTKRIDQYRSGQLLTKGTGLETAVSLSDRCKKVIQVSWIFVAYSLVIIMVGTTIAWMYSFVSREWVYAFSVLFTDTDIFVGGVAHYANILDLFDTIPAISYVILQSYFLLPIVLGSVATMLACTSLPRFREFMLSFFLISLFCIPLWILMPAVSPTHYLREGVVGDVAPEHAQVSALMHQAVQNASPYYQEASRTLEIMWRPREAAPENYAVSTNPSMHFAWGFLCAVYAFVIGRWIGIAVVMYQVANMFGTVLSLQHYMIDIPTGLLMMVLTILVSRALIRFEDRYMQVDVSVWFRGLVILKDEVQFFLRSWVQDARTMRARLFEK